MRINFLYELFQKIGYDHPLHPAVTHMPAGLVAGAFIFLVIGLIFKRRIILTTARHCIVLALIFLFPTTFLGYTDWMHYYNGVWSFPITIKIILTPVLLILLSVAIILGRSHEKSSMIRLVVYFLSLATVAVIGYYGSDLVYPKSINSSITDINQGKILYAANCGQCHPRGGNTANLAIPVVGSPTFKDSQTFTKFCRNPLRPDGSKGEMPAFTKEKISDQDLQQIYQYITKGFEQK